MDIAAILLTGGSSRRMGRDKATMTFPGPSGSDGVTTTMAGYAGSLLASISSLAIEVGPGHSGLPAVADDRPGTGPLAAVLTGLEALARHGWAGPCLVLATDMPQVTDSLLTWLAAYPAAGAVVPVEGGRAQPLCARYPVQARQPARCIVEGGGRSMAALLDVIPVTWVGPQEWEPAAGCRDAMRDVDTPQDAAAMLRP